MVFFDFQNILFAYGTVYHKNIKQNIFTLAYLKLKLVCVLTYGYKNIIIFVGTYFTNWIIQIFYI